MGVIGRLEYFGLTVYVVVERHGCLCCGCLSKPRRGAPGLVGEGFEGRLEEECRGRVLSVKYSYSGSVCVGSMEAVMVGYLTTGRFQQLDM